MAGPRKYTQVHGACPTGATPELLLYRASFVLWFGAITIHVLGHVLETARLASLDGRPLQNLCLTLSVSLESTWILVR
jgi:hypothetical protein